MRGNLLSWDSPPCRANRTETRTTSTSHKLRRSAGTIFHHFHLEFTYQLLTTPPIEHDSTTDLEIKTQALETTAAEGRSP